MSGCYVWDEVCRGLKSSRGPSGPGSEKANGKRAGEEEETSEMFQRWALQNLMKNVSEDS